MFSPPTWYIPSFYGDVKLEATSETTCNLIKSDLTQQEKTALMALGAVARKKKWIDGELTLDSVAIPFKAPIDKVSRQLAKLLKPGRTVISAVRFHDGTMEEVREAAAQVPEVRVVQEAEAPASATSASGDEPTSTGKRKKAIVGASVAAPVRGCPAPDFAQAEIRAARVLSAFLSPDQLADFKRFNRFISVGQVTGNRYMVTSRNARDQLAYYTRSLYDLERKVELCAHDWDVPAAEEMLALHLLLQLPGWECYLRDATEDNLEDSLRRHMGAQHGMLTFHDGEVV